MAHRLACVIFYLIEIVVVNDFFRAVEDWLMIEE